MEHEVKRDWPMVIRAYSEMAIIYFVTPLLIKLAWNVSMSRIFGLFELSYWQAVGLYYLWRLIIKPFTNTRN